MHVIRVATRRSPLALWQADHVADRLRELHPHLEVELVPLTTRADKLVDVPLSKVGGKALFVKELEHALFEGAADIAVHSMKDVPVTLPDGLQLPVVMAREDPRDAFVSVRHSGLDALPSGARVGTCSLRRRCQLLALRPDLVILDLRGNVNTRLRKLDEGLYDAIILAVAGLERLGMGERIAEYLEPTRLLPAIGQGAMGIECRQSDREVDALIAPLRDPRTSHCVAAERAMNARLGGSCQVPVAGFAEQEGDALRLHGLVGRLDGAEIIREQASAPATQAEALGQRLAEALLARGAGEILAALHDRDG